MGRPTLVPRAVIGMNAGGPYVWFAAIA
jgi:hypothetical protein